MYGRYNPQTSIFAGMSAAQLQQALAAAQQAYLDLSTGSKPVSVSYTQGASAKSVTYSRAEIANLTMLIKQLQAQLGLVEHPRRAIRPLF